MGSWLVGRFIKDSENVKDADVRERYGVLTGIVGIICNLFLSVSKLAAGLFSGSVAITADGLNNLSDAGSSVVTMIGFRIARRPADSDHPFGHGRAEYISGLIVSFLIMLMGFELLQGSFHKILHPEDVQFGLVPVTVLLLSIAVKLWMFFFQRKIAGKLSSNTMWATAKDSISDVTATSVVLAGMLLYGIWDINIDGYSGLAVSLFIMYTGFSAARDTVDDLVGHAPEPEFVEAIERKVLSFDGITGVHDLIVHNYGPGRTLVSLHAEVPCNIDILAIHDTIDNIERELRDELRCEAVIHMDPIITDDTRVKQHYHMVRKLVQDIDSELSIHDFRMVEGPTHTNLIFDVLMPYGFRLDARELEQILRDEIFALKGSYRAVVNIDRPYY